MSRWPAMVLTVAVAACGAEPDAPDGAQRGEPARERAAPAPPPPPPPMTAADSAAALARLAAEADALRAVFDSVRALTAREVAELRQDRNAEQIAIARRLGLRASGTAEIERLRRAGRLVPLGDSTPYWVLREMDHSVPYVTPDTRAMLEEVGRRFHARLDSLGLPRYRMKITSALRTDEDQARLRRINPNASRVESAHEFGTTVDVSYERFGVPAPPAGPLSRARALEEEMLEELGKERVIELRALLGRAIAEMRDESSLLVMMENGQTVYHMTVARRFPASVASR